MIGGTLLATGAAGGLFFALLTGWLGIELLREVVATGFKGGERASAVFRMLSFGLITIGASALVAGIGRFILGPRTAA